ncbi:MAG: hypothetical protein E7640_06025 [Ruminococcaceae bacterium]|nr:hypothetical protein [Oscillospiraceae bacterium]
MKEKYFAASNSRRGFVSYYDDAFGGTERVYIIKGGPGTGKSYFMKKIAEAAEGARLSVVYIYCSSDPESLDGIVIDRRIAILDGTAPHAVEATLPGAREELIDLGSFFYGNGLSARCSEIAELAKKKGEAYRRAYDCLSAAGQLCEAADALILRSIDFEKLKSAAARSLRHLPNGTEPKKTELCISSIGMRGEVRFSTLEEKAKSVVCVRDVLATAHIYFDALLAEAERKRLTVRISRDPVMPEHIDALELGGLLFTTADIEGARAVNMKRFIDRATAAEVRREHRALTSAMDVAVECAKLALSDAAKNHFALEEIYISYVNFGEKEKFTQEFTKKLMYDIM